MSTEHQQYSIVNQADAIEGYAAEHKLTIVKKFIDAGKSGLTLAGRPALRQLLLEVLSGNAQFEHVLVYDVSRWGRFQDADESAYYEYTCKKANIRLHYCVEQFTNDGSPYSALLKALKRTMAGEYSRELSVKVHAAQRRFAGMGFHQGGSAGYGLDACLSMGGVTPSAC
jgi:DNA invertase Pin-like site-specific DNA recombinase